MNATEKLSNILDKSIRHQKEMLDVVNQKFEHIRNADITKLNDLLIIEDQLVENMRGIEKERKEIFNENYQRFNLDPSSSKLSDIIAYVDTESAKDLSKKRSTLIEIASRVRQRNEDNMLVLRASIDHIDTFFKTVGKAVSTKTYERDGRENSKGNIRLVDQQA